MCIRDSSKALLTGKLGGIFGVGVILDVRQDDDIVVLLHRTGRGIEAVSVSYTHLDVYKRQVRKRRSARSSSP